MPNLEETYNWGQGLYENNKDLYEQLNDVYQSTAFIVNTKISKRVIDGTSPPASNPINRNFEIGDIWVRTDLNTAWIMTSRTSDVAVTWTQIT